MLRRPIFWGVVVLSISLLGWVVAIIVSVLTAGALKDMANICAYVAIASLPIGALGELVLWAKRGEMTDSNNSATPSRDAEMSNGSLE